MHVGRAGDPLDEYVTAIVLALLAPRRHRLQAHPHVKGLTSLCCTPNVGRCRPSATSWPRMFTDGVLDGAAVRRESARLDERIAGIDRVLAEAVAHQSRGAAAGRRPRRTRKPLGRSSPDIQGKIVDELMTVTVLPAPRGPKAFNPEFVEITPK